MSLDPCSPSPYSAPVDGPSGAPSAEAPPAPKPWGFWATIAFSLVVLIAFFLIQMVGAIVWGAIGVALDPGLSLIDAIQKTAASDVPTATIVWASGVGCTVLLALFAACSGWSAREYLAVRPMRLSSAALWIVVTAAAALTADLVSRVVGGSELPEDMVNLYRNAVCPPLLLSAIVLGGPLFEEVFFRGFFYRGVAASPLGPAGAVIVASAVWTALHVTYPPFHLGVIFMLGLLLGAVRAKTGSVSVTLLMHAVWNAIASAEVYWSLAAGK